MSRLDPRSWDAVVFDVDGTLYEQRLMRRRMLVELALHALRHPGQIGLLRRLQTFRRQRELIGERELEGARRLQYELPAERLGVSADSLSREVVEWMERRPLRHLADCRVPGVRRFFAHLRAAGIRIAVLSDYAAADKLAALGLEASLIVSGIDPDVDRLKPHPAGLEAVLGRLDAPRERCLMIGDRDDRDGECARRAGVACLLRRTSGEPEPGWFRTYLELLPGDARPSGAGA